jgi:adenosylhomocysteine nucleosidase
MKSEVRSQKPDGVTLVCFALKEEAAPFEKIMAGRSCAGFLLTGIGRKKAENAVRYFFAHPIWGTLPELVLTCGFAGGLNPDLKLGEVVFEIFSGSSRGNEAQIAIGNRQSAIRNQSEPPHVGCYKKLIAAGAKPGKFLCADQIATTVAEKKKLRDETGADAVEMESEAIHAVCRERGIPCATVRVISDPANEDLPLDFNQLSKPDLSLDYGKLALAIAKSPGKIPALMRLQKNSRFAAERLADVLAKVIWPL